MPASVSERLASSCGEALVQCRRQPGKFLAGERRLPRLASAILIRYRMRFAVVTWFSNGEQSGTWSVTGRAPAASSSSVSCVPLIDGLVRRRRLSQEARPGDGRHFYPVFFRVLRRRVLPRRPCGFFGAFLSGGGGISGRRSCDSNPALTISRIALSTAGSVARGW